MVTAPEKKYCVRVRIWVDEESGPFIGHGRVLLLEKINETGSITNAAKAIKMSYRQAWQLVEDMNKRSRTPLVIKVLGGKNGGGARLSEEGIKMIERFYAIVKDVQQYTEMKTQSFLV